MSGVVSRYRSFGRPVRLLLLNQLAINVGFYMLMPYLAEHLSTEVGLATWTIGLVLGVRNFSQQGMFLVGGSLADRLGYKPLIVAGCVLRTAGFALLGVVESVPALIIAAATTGFAGALFSPAVRAYLAEDAGDRRVDAFALFNVFYQTGILIGPLVGLLLTGVAFRVTCLVAAAMFGVLSLVQIRALPTRADAGTEARDHGATWLDDWRGIAANRAFVRFSLAMIGSYVLSFQVYLALPLAVRRAVGDGIEGTAGVTALFVVSATVAVVGQVSVTAWCQRRWSHAQCLVRGLALMAAAFVLPAVPMAGRARLQSLPPLLGTAVEVGPLILTAGVLALGTAVVFPFEMDTIVALADGRLVATHYGLYSTICGVGILGGNLLTGAALDLAHAAGLPAAPWLLLALIGCSCAAALHSLGRDASIEALGPAS